jgi:glycosyltransferase involved in cell wall biosynthesis
MSVIMPVYNQERYVRRAILSILSQTFRDYEFIIVDDGSTDRTIEIVKQFDDERIRLLTTPHIGFIDALTLGMSAARGTWLARMDSDDLCPPDRLEKQLVFLERHPECVFVTSYYGIVTPNDRFLTPTASENWTYIEPKDITLSTKPFCDAATVFDRRRALAAGYDPEFKWEKTLWYELLKGGRGAVLEEPLYFVRWRAGSVSRGGNSYPHDMAYKLRLKYDPENAVSQKSAAIRLDMRSEKKSVWYYAAAGDFREARTTALMAWKRFPYSVEAVKLVLNSLGVRRPRCISGPAGMTLFPTEMSL